MKTNGISTDCLTLEDALTKGVLLTNSQLLWGNLANFDRLNFDQRKIKVFLLYYFESLTASVIFYEKKYLNSFRIGSSPHPNAFTQSGHIFISKLDSQRAQEQLSSEFFNRFTDYITKNFVSFELSLPPDLLDVRELIKNGWKITPRYTYILDLEEIKKVGLSKYVGKKVRNIVKYAAMELKVKKISYDEFYNCYSETYMRQNRTTPKPKKLFRAYSSLPNIIFLGAFSGKNLAAGIMICEEKDKANFLAAGIIREYHNSNGITLLLYTYLESLLTREQSEIKLFDFVGANYQYQNVDYYKAWFQPKILLYFSARKENFQSQVAKKAIEFGHRLNLKYSL